MSWVTVLLLLFAISTGVALIARRIKAPYTVALVFAGIFIGSSHAFEPPHLTKELLYSLFLPGLVFEAAFHLDAASFFRNKWAIVSLALPGVAASMLITATVLAPGAAALGFAALTFGPALLFAGLIAATDPIAVVALFKSLGAPKRLGVLVEGESLLNDGTAVVFFTMVSTSLFGGEVTAIGGVIEFVKVVGMGALIGAALGLAVSAVIARVDAAMIEITLTTIAAYGAFEAAEHFHFSGVIATVVSGMILGNYARQKGMSPTTRVAVETFWEYVAFALNSLVFLLIGFEVHLEALLASWPIIVLAYLAVTLGRTLVVGLVTAALSRTREKISFRWSLVLVWGGLRGALSMVLVLALPSDFAQRELLVTMTFGVVLLSLVGQGLTMGPLLRALKVIDANAKRHGYERLRGGLRASRAALEALQKLLDRGVVHASVGAALKKDYEASAHAAEEAIAGLHLDSTELEQEERLSTQRSLLAVEKAAVLEAQRDGLLAEHAFSELMADIDARTVELDGAGHD